MITFKKLTEKLDDTRAYLSALHKPYRKLALRREGGAYCLVEYMESGSYQQKSDWINAREMWYFLDGYHKAVLLFYDGI